MKPTTYKKLIRLIPATARGQRLKDLAAEMRKIIEEVLPDDR